MQIKLPLQVVLLGFSIFLMNNSTAAPEVAAFKSEEEMVEGWYHRHETASWLRRGARGDVIEQTLRNIAASTGAKRDQDLVDTQLEYSAGNWVFEWVMSGDASMARATQLKGNDKRDAASWPHLGREEDKLALEKARIAYLKLAEASDLSVRHVTFAVLDTTSKGYLHLPKGNGPFPLMIFTHGSDVTKEDGLEVFTEEMGPVSGRLRTSRWSGAVMQYLRVQDSLSRG